LGRRLGQHFLRSQPILEKIARAACPEPEPLVIEIGPGQGALTALLVPRTQRLIAIEIDELLIAALTVRFPGVEVISADVLSVDLAQWGPAVIAGNLPYYITSPILSKILEAGFACRRAVLMMQREVAERLTAPPGTRDYGYLSVLVQSQSVTELLFRVPPGAFSPPPKVDSAVVALRPIAERPSREFLRFAAAAFRQKRKNLRNNLAALYPAITDMPEASHRAEQLSVAQLQNLHARLVS
jgi:16S rRNA (adenine1518-N6/adenine1519-N6)-dimethyltransferase